MLRKAALQDAINSELPRGSCNEAILRCTDDADAEVRLAGIQVLPKLAERGDERAVRALASRCSDSQPGVRLRAVQGLGHIAEDGDACALCALKSGLRDCDAANLLQPCPSTEDRNYW